MDSSADYPASLRNLKRAEEDAAAAYIAAYRVKISLGETASMDDRIAADVAERRASKMMCDTARAYTEALNAFVEAA